MAGSGHAVALEADGSVWTWGLNDAGQLGDSTVNSNSTPRQVTGITGTVTKIAAGLDTTYIMKSDGTVWGWGHGLNGELGGTTNSNTAVRIGTFSGATNIAAGKYTAYALLGTGTVEAWGANDYGQIGNGATSTSPVAPYAVAGTFASIAAGDSHAVAITTGTPVVKAWGRGTEGEVGDGGAVNRNTPTTVGFPTGTAAIASVDAGPFTSAAVTVNGDLFEWGANTYGQIGDGTTTQVNSPKAVLGQL
ncbi:MAG: hypothetical protein ABIW84_07965, partial [Ilumatobacteraceae bacterium]